MTTLLTCLIVWLALQLPLGLLVGRFCALSGVPDAEE